MKSTNVVILILFSALLILTSCPAPYNPPEEISVKEANSYINNFAERNEGSFAKYYRVDISVMERMGNMAQSLYVLHGLNDNREKVIIIGPVDDNAEVIPEGPYFLQNQTNLCPPMCDAAFTPATRIDRAMANRYIENFRQSGLDNVRAFLITQNVLASLGSVTGTEHLKVHNGQKGDERCLIIRASGSRGEDINSPIFLQDQTTLCPPMCDISDDGVSNDR